MLPTSRKSNRRRNSRFAARRQRPTGTGGSALIRFRRNRELMARELVVLALWGGLALLLGSLAGTLWRVAEVHLVDRGRATQLALPTLAILAGLGCLWRARRALREFLDIRREQAGLTERLRDPGQDDLPPA